MKIKKIRLDEALFEDDKDLFDLDIGSDYDDDLSMDEHELDNVLSGPAAGADAGVADILINLINDEWEAIQGYNSAVANLRAWAHENPFYSDAIKVIDEINAEENRHVGQLQELLKNISPNAQDIEKGQEEAHDQLRFVGGKLQVQSWDTPTSNTPNNNAVECEDNICTLTDIDDEM